ncbi:hypothetical protein [Actinomadura decatromicini]|uniref:Uncharacterized protein n=1 Tax=Actinomadura decatromicini TaxID=2604572 RepID=A0A5D3G0K9_9ACTN|nr:hypothetical protein [Actinomadura decatromicini]TYK53025.1 hypothetical protein FXF68_04620 [Actinomadura decatromicini]
MSDQRITTNPDEAIMKGMIVMSAPPSRFREVVDRCAEISQVLRERALTEIILWALAINGFRDLISRF